MNRRTFLQGMGASVLGVSGIDALIRRISNPTYMVEVYQTDILTEKLEESPYRSDRGLINSYEAILPFEEYFGKKVEVSLNYEPVPQEILNTSDSSGVSRAKSVVNWRNYSPTYTDDSNHIHLLLGSTTYESRVYGAASFALLPTCCTPLNRYGIVWSDGLYQKTDYSEQFQKLLLHEFGHAVGLYHYHGCNYEEGRSVMMSNPYAERFKRNIFGQKVYPDTSIHKFNTKLTESHLRDF